MAVAEARALWQRTANRLFVQEDAKRAPKLACCQSSSSTSKPANCDPTSALDWQDYPPVASMPLNRHPYSNLSPDTRWWLEMQCSSRCQYGLTSELLNTSETEVETIPAGSVNSSSKACGVKLEKETDSILHISDLLSDCSKKDSDSGRPGLKALHSKTLKECKLEDTREHAIATDAGLENYTLAKQSDEVCFHSESSWFLCEKAEPWWRTADRNELASLVAQKSLDLVVNCDLPPPQKKHVRRKLSACPGCVDCSESFPSPLDLKESSGCISDPRVVQMKGSSNTATHGKGVYTSLDEDVLSYNSEKSFRFSSPTYKDAKDDDKALESDPIKAQILEALHHSQTRAMEAEKAAKQACAETERILKIFFRQASQLFAYKQWLRLLQIEALHVQKKNSHQPPPNHSPVILPLAPHGKLNSQKTAAKGKCRKRGQPGFDITKYAVTIALGLSLSAGLILGWTVAWLLPAF